MATTKIRLKGRGLISAEAGAGWQLQLEPVDDSKLVVVDGTDEDLPAFKKALGKTVEARLTIGAEDEPTGNAGELAEQLRVEKALTADLGKQNDANLERLKVLEEQLAAAKEAKPAAAILPDDERVKIIRGNVRALHETAEANMSTGKASDAAKWGQAMRQARLALEALDQLVPGAKPALKLATPPTAEA